MPGLIKAENTSFLGQMKVSISRTPAPKQVHSVISSRAFAISLDAPTNYLSSGPLALLDTRATRHPTLTINDLPPEILAEIFYTYLFWEDESDLIDPELEGLIPVIEPSSRAAPLLFCQVCSYWREVAISTPSLWSSIALKETVQLDTVKLWLQRSRNHPLSFLIQFTASRSSPTKWASLPDLLNLLYANIHRWQDIYVSLPTTEDMRSFSSVLLPTRGESPASTLRSADISNGGWADYLDDEMVARLSCFPHNTIRRFVWGESRIPKFELEYPLWQNIQQLTFLNTTTGVLFAFLNGCPGLKSVNVNVWRTECLIGMPTNPILAPRLEILHIDQVSGDLASALPLLFAPGLKRLSYSQYDDPGQTNLLESFLIQSRCKLSCLSVLYGSYSFDNDEVRRMLTSRHIREIPHLSVRLPKESFSLTFLRSILGQNIPYGTSSGPHTYLNTLDHIYHFGWGGNDFLREYDGYPFLIKRASPSLKWRVANKDGPTTSAW